MIKKFLSSSLVYAGSALTFSIGRQIVFLPALNKLSPELFKEISFLLVMIDFLVYSMGASIADYYVKQVTENDKKFKVYKFLFTFSFLSLISISVFLFYNFSILLSILSALYLLLYILNTLQMKLFFNNMQFSKNYLYIIIRLIPYFLLLVYILFVDVSSLLFFVISLVISELISFCTFKKQLSHIYDKLRFIEKSDIKNDVIFFIITYLLIALVLRFDMLFIEYNFPDNYSEYYQIISIYMIFINPVVLLTSTSLLSILTKVSFDDFKLYKYKILFATITISLSAGLLFQVIGVYIVNILYPGNQLINQYSFLSFLVIFTTLSFQIFKTFLVKYQSVTKLFIYNIFIVVVTSLLFNSFLYFIIMFYCMRFIVYLIQFMLLEKK
jgi:O-antigen/teichoic acid export membrane protein